MLLIIVTVILCIISGVTHYIYRNWCSTWREAVSDISSACFVIFVFILACEMIGLAITNIGVEGDIASNEQKRASLVYQLENNLYDNDNDLGKKELYKEIEEWNSNLACGKTLMNDSWIGVFYPNELYENFDFIEY